MDIQSIKQRFGIIGNSPLMLRAIDIAMQVASTDLSVLITGESGTGKEFFPKILHALSPRKHAAYVAINCGAIPEGTIDSELFGHEKGSFTDAKDARKGYFEEADGGTIFLDEVAELPLSTQARLLRVLESGEFLKVGSSKAQKTNVRVVAATNVDFTQAIAKGKFREDLYYRLNTIAIKVPPLRERKEDIELLFRKFTTDLSEKYRIPPLELSPEAKIMLINYPWRGNIRELKNITEQMSILEQDRTLSKARLSTYLPQQEDNLPILVGGGTENLSNGMSERDMLYNLLFMQKDIQELKNAVHALESLFKSGPSASLSEAEKLPEPTPVSSMPEMTIIKPAVPSNTTGLPFQKASSFHMHPEEEHHAIVLEDDLSLDKKEKLFIEKALNKHGGNRRKAAEELGISERTIYRKIKEYGIDID